jgi:acyl carrier protein
MLNHSGLHESSGTVAERGAQTVQEPISSWPEVRITGGQSGGERPLSAKQEELWFREQLHPGSSAHSLNLVLRLSVSADKSALELAFSAVLDRHDVLRARFFMEKGVLRQSERERHFAIDEIVVSQGQDAGSELLRIWSEEIVQPFSLEQGPLFRCKLVRGLHNGDFLILAVHHIVADQYSLRMLAREALAFYQAAQEGRSCQLQPLGIQYSDFARAQREWLEMGRLEPALSLWRKQLAGAPPLLPLPYDFPPPAAQDHRGGAQRFTVPARLVDELQSATQEGMTNLPALLLAIWEVLLTRYSGTQDIVLGAAVAGREHPATTGLIGPFENVLPLRTWVDPQRTLAGLAQHIQRALASAREYPGIALEQLVDANAESIRGHNPICQVAFSFLDVGDVLPELSIVELTADRGQDLSRLDEGSIFDLSLSFLLLQDGSLSGTCRYRTSLFTQETVNRLMQRYTSMLEAAAAHWNQPISQLHWTEEEEVTQPDEAQTLVDLAQVGHMAELASGGWTADILARTGVAAVGIMGLTAESSLAVLDRGDQELVLLAKAAAAVVGATVNLVDETTAAKSNPTHVLLTAETLAGLKQIFRPNRTTLVVAGLPCFASALARWKGFKCIGLWRVAQVALCCASLKIEAPAAVISEPAPGCSIEVLDDEMKRRPVDLWGEIYLGGDFLNTSADPAAWVDDPFVKGRRLYRTRFVARRRASGRIELAGWRERMMPIAGMRIDPEWLDSLLRQHPALKASAVQVRSHKDGNWLLAWVQPSPGRAVSEQELQRYVAERLGGAFIPAKIVLTGTAPPEKVENLALPQQAGKQPSTPTEAVLARIWSEVLKKPQRDKNLNFFDLGGNSMTSVEMLSRVRDLLQARVELHRLFEAPTIAELARLVEDEYAKGS